MKITPINNNQTFKGKHPVLQTKEQIAKYLKKQHSFALADICFSGGTVASGLFATLGIMYGVITRNDKVAYNALAFVGAAIATGIASLGCFIKSKKMQKITDEAIETLRLNNIRNNAKKVRSASMAISRRLKRLNKEK